MKLLVLFFGILLPTLGLSATALDVCDNVNRQNSGKGAECFQIVNQAKSIDNNGVEPCHVISFRDPFATVQCISAMVNNVYDSGAVRACVVVARKSPMDVPSCMIASANKIYAPETAYACQQEAYRDPRAGVKCLESKGTPSNKGTCPTTQMLRETVSTSIDMIKNKNNDQAVSLLEVLLENLNNCN